MDTAVFREGDLNHPADLESVAYLDRQENGETVFIFECCFLQNPLTMLLGRHDEPIPAAEAFILELAELVRGLRRF